VGSELRLSEVIAALSHALDLTEGLPVGHAERTCLIGLRIADRLGLPEADRSALFYALLLKDAGCSSSAARMTALFGADDLMLKHEGKLVEWANPRETIAFTTRHVAPGRSPLRRARKVAGALRGLAAEATTIVQTRCERGADIVTMLGLPAASADAVRTLDERWDGRGQPSRIAGEDLPLLGRIASVAQTMEVFLHRFGREAARDTARQRSGGAFDPRIADAFLAIGDGDPLWPSLASDAQGDALSLLEPRELVRLASEDDLDRIAEAFARVIDAKSPFTAKHSEGVARYAVAIAEQLDFDAVALRDLRRAGLLHDVGKLGISNAILDKPSKLTDEEFRQIRLHPAYSEQILLRIRAFRGWAVDAAAHHERLDGRGYHRGVDGSALSPAARTLAVADVYEALTADRPYRGPMAPDEALALMRRDVGTAFCPHAFAALEGGLTAWAQRGELRDECGAADAVVHAHAMQREA
jgi:HD-GYP domain-containing protein (c-di-GMP phosphodiesterase class II)